MTIEEQFLALPRWQREQAFKVVKAKRKLEGSNTSINVLELMAAHKSTKGVA
jgi:hypothetical protein